MDNPNNQDIQALVQELQLARNQIQTVSTQINEISLTLESLSKQDKNRPVFRAVGNLLLEVDDRDELVNELSTSCLLYTSPSPRDATLSRMPSSA